MAITEPYSPTTKYLLNLISSLQSGVRATGQVPVTDAANPETLAKNLSSFQKTDANTVQQAQQDIGRGRTTLAQLPLDTRKLVESTQNIKNTTGPVHRGFLGSITHDVENVGGSALSHIGDLLSRGQYAVAGGVNSAVNEAVSHGSNTPGGFVKDLVYGAKGFGEGALKGVEGKDKASFQNDFQHDADLVHAGNKGLTGKEQVSYATSHPDSGHINPIFNGVAGTAADIFLDPTTYIGAGAVGKVLKGAKFAKDSEIGERVAHNAEKIGVSDAPTVRKALGLDAFKPGKTLTRQLPTVAKVTKIQTEGIPVLKEYASKAAKITWDEAIERAKKVVPFPHGGGEIAGKLPETFAENEADIAKQSTADQQLWRTKVEQEAKRDLGDNEQGLRDKAFTHLLTIQHRMTAPTVNRELGLTIGGKRIGSVSVEKLAKKANGLQSSDSVLGRGLQKFQKGFYNSAGLRNDVKEVSTRIQGATGYSLRGYLHLIHHAFDSTDEATRSRLAENFIDKTDVPVRNPEGLDLLDSFKSQVHRVQEGIKPLTDDFSSAAELKKNLPLKLQKDFDLKAISEKVGRKQVLKENWLDPIVEKWLKSSDKDVKNPSHIMYYLEHAYRQAHSEAETLRTLGSHLGHNVRQDETIAGNAQPLVNEATRHYMKQGYRQATYETTRNGKKVRLAIPYIKGTVFDPETAGHIEKLYELQHSTNPYGKLNDFLKTYDKGTKAFKSLVTKYNPGYYERNLLGETLAGFFGGVDNPNRYVQAARVLHGRDKTLMGDGLEFGNVTGKNEIRAANALHFNPKVAAAKQPITVFKGGGKTYKLTADQWFHAYAKVAGLKTAFIHEDLDIGVDAAKRKTTQVLQRMNNKVQGGAEGVEDLPRMAHFIDATMKAVKRGETLPDAMTHAASEVRKYHFDFSDFTPTEKAIMTRIFPFYKWTRKNIPLMMEMTLTHPGKALVPIKTLHGISTSLGYQDNGQNLPPGDLVVPNWLRKDMAVPVGQSSGGNTNYLDAPIPWSQAWEALQSPVSTEGLMQNPLLQLKSVIETGKFPSGETSHGNAAIINNLPEVSIIHNLLTHKAQGKSTKTLLEQFLLGMGLQENTENRMFAQAKSDQQAATNRRLTYRKQTGQSNTTRHPGVY